MGHRSESKLCLSIVMKIDGLANRVSRQLQLQAYLLATSSLYPIATRAVASNWFVYFHGWLFATLVIIVCPLLRISRCVSFFFLLFFSLSLSPLRVYDYHRRSTIAIEQPRILLAKRKRVYIHVKYHIDSQPTGPKYPW